MGERTRARAGERRLLLGDGQRQHVARRATGRGHQPSGLSGDVAPDPVVQRARDDPVVTELRGLGVDHRHVADAHQLPGFVAVFCPDVDVEVLCLGHLLAVLVLQEVDRLAADHAGDLPLAGA